jgi:hypothetical protein
MTVYSRKYTTPFKLSTPSSHHPQYLSISLFVLLGGHTNFIHLELVYSNQHNSSSSSQSPSEHLITLGIRSLWNIISDHGIESDVRMYNDGRPDESIEDGSVCSCYEGHDDERDDCHGKRAFKSPVIRSVCFVGFGNWDGIVDCSSD